MVFLLLLILSSNLFEFLNNDVSQPVHSFLKTLDLLLEVFDCSFLCFIKLVLVIVLFQGHVFLQTLQIGF